MEHSIADCLDHLHENWNIRIKITPEQYDDWRRGFVFDGLRNLSYGQSFCRRFGIQDHVLNRSDSGHRMDQYIRKHYVR